MTALDPEFAPSRSPRPAQHAFARTDRSPLGMWWWTVDHWLLGIVAALILLGVWLSFGSSPAAAIRTGEGGPFHFAIRQTLFAGMAAAIVVGVSMLSPRNVRRLAFAVYLVMVAIMAALPFLGHQAKGATRWLDVGPLMLQPSEFVKPALAVLSAWMFAEAQKGQGVPGVSIAAGLWAVVVALLLLQPDVGQTVLVTAVVGAAFFMAGMPMKWIGGLAAAAMAGLVGIYFAFDHFAARLNKFLNPEAADTHQVDRAAEAIAAGGLFGRGPGEGVMKRHVPDLHTDFIYSVAAEEFGLWFSLTLIGLFAALVLRGLYKALRLSDPFEQVAAAALFVLAGVQACINVAVNLNLMPTKGMTLPFISYGGSSMLAMGLTLGMALALTRRRPGAYGQPIEPRREPAREPPRETLA
jgi:cell division protein FtsW